MCIKFMFNIKQTRLLIVLILCITVLFSFIGLNWKKEEEKKIPSIALLKVPKIYPGFIRKTSKPKIIKGEVKTIDLTIEEIAETQDKNIKYQKKQYPKTLDNKGATIILD